MWGEGSKMATQASPLPQVAGRWVKSGGSILPPPPPTWRPSKDPPPITWPGEREGGNTRHFSIYSLIKGYFKRPISQNISAKLAPSLLQCQNLPISFLRAVSRENVPYIVTYGPPKRPAILSRLHYILQATSLQKAVNINNKAGQNSTRGTVSSLLFFPLKSTAAHSLHIQHPYVDWGYRFKTPIAKEAFR